jgi:Fe-S cluster biogenesis protein NfuA
MAGARDARATGERVEALLAELRTRAGPQAADAAEELVGCLVELYGAGLTTIVAVLAADPEAGPRLLGALAGDPLVESLLLVHDLHPLDADARIDRALEQVRGQLGSHAGAIEYLGIDDRGVAAIRLTASGHGCGSSSGTVAQTIEEAVAEAAPELAGVHVEEVTAPPEVPLLQIMRRPAGAR